MSVPPAMTAMGPVVLGVFLTTFAVSCANPAQPVASGPRSQAAASSTPAGTSAESRWPHSIPDTVRIDTNIHTGRDGTISTQGRDVRGASLLGICGEPPDLDDQALDRVGVEAPDHPGDSRTLYLYADDAEATQRFALVRDWLAGCDSAEEGSTTQLRSSKVGDASLLEVITDARTGAGPTGRWLRLVRVGNALLLTDSDDGELPGPALERDIRDQLDDVIPVVRQLKVFAVS